MEIVKCCKNCKWLEEFPRKNWYGDVDHICMRSGMHILGSDIEKDLTKYMFSSEWTRKNCNYSEKTVISSKDESKV